MLSGSATYPLQLNEWQPVASLLLLEKPTSVEVVEVVTVELEAGKPSWQGYREKNQS